MRLVIFDVDGTLVDSQGDITAAMSHAFEAEGLTPLGRAEVLGIVGLSLPEAMVRLVPEADAAVRARLVQGYKDAYMALRAENGVAQSSPLYPGVRAMLDDLAGREDLLLGIATGKSRKGLDKLLDGHGLRGMFATEQVADHHPSKPHPAMLVEAMAECGLGAEAAVMVGDTSFDMEMARAAGIPGVGVSWGYHDVTALGAARIILDEMAALPAALDEIWRDVA